MRLVEKALDAIYPRMCPLCGRASDRRERFLCWNCLSSLNVCSEESPHCSVCGKVPGGDVEGAFVCEECAAHRPSFDLARSALSYAGPVRDLVHGFKYSRQIWLQRDFGDILEACARSCFDVREVDLVVPVPLFAVKFVLRSYNQSELLAGELAGRIGVPCEGGLLRRVKDTPTQTHLGAEGRRKNVAGAFAVLAPELVASRTALVVDDVMTTGATLGEIADALKKAGAWRVWCLTLARAPMGR